MASVNRWCLLPTGARRYASSTQTTLRETRVPDRRLAAGVPLTVAALTAGCTSDPAPTPDRRAPPQSRQDAERVVLQLAEAGMPAPVMRARDGELGG
jgi:hypothetical protein